MGSVEDKRIVLPKTVKPVHYDLSFAPNLFPEEGKEPTFSGSAVISVKVLEETDVIVMNSKELNVTHCSVCAGDTCQKAEISFDEKKETVTLKLEEKLSVGDYTIDAEFNGILNAKMMGFYRSEYKDPADETKKKFMAVTQFEATDARMAFPCFDEPNLKATFSVEMTAPETYDCLSNMPVIETTSDGKGSKTVKFDKSPIMSTYLLAFVVAELDKLEATTPEGIEFRVYTEKGRSHLGHFALECGVKTISFFASFFEIPYPLPKMDMIAIPDFAAGAMENWGLVTYRETALLLDPNQSAAAAKSRVAEVVAHELAHQWFGNLVTMDWWTHLWLNEGFATWAADLAVDTMFPEWKVWVQFVCTTFASALRLDSLVSSHAIEVEMNDAAEVNEIFDAISYLKGASVIRMLANYVTVDVFKQGLITYLNQFSYSNAATEDLWHHLEIASGKPIKQLMGNWTKQVGYPVLDVTEGPEGQISVSQARFLSNGSVDADKPQWMVPIGVLEAGGGSPTYQLLEGETGDLDGVNTKNAAWIKLNATQSGIFRVKYPRSMAAKLSNAIKNNELGPEDRSGLLNDCVALARAGMQSTVDALEIMQSFENEKEYTCILDLCLSLSEFSRLFGDENEETTAGFKRLAYKLLYPLSQELGWDPKPDEPHVESLMRSQLIGTLIEFDHGPTIEEAVKKFRAYKEDGLELAPDLRLSSYYAAVKQLGEEGYNAVLKIYEETDLNEEKVRCIRSLGAAKEPALLERTLVWGMKEVKAQDVFYVINAVAKNRLGRDMAWEFLQKEWEGLVERFGKGSTLNTRFVQSCTSDYYSEEKAVEIEAFFSTATTVGITRTLEQCLESIRSRAAWYQRDSSSVNEWIAKAT